MFQINYLIRLKQKIRKSKIFLLFFLLSLIVTFYGFRNSFGDSSKTIESHIKAISPIQVSYYHIMDDNSTKPKKNTDVILLFEPSGKVLLYVQSPTDMLAHHGTWQFDKGQMRLKFQTDELIVDSVFPMDLNREKVIMPFRIFSGDKGSSQWVRRILRIDHAVHMVFRGAIIDPTQRLTADEAITRTVDFARGVIEIYHKKRSGNFSLSRFANKIINIFELFGRTSLLYAQDVSLWPKDWLKVVPSEVSPFKNGVKLKYMDGSEAEVLLFSWGPSPSSALQLRPSPLINDPRHHIHAKPTGDTRFDPPNKTALFISPFNSVQIISWYDALLNKAINTGVVPKTSDGFPWDSIKKELVKNKYEIEELKNENVTVENLIERLYWRTPGMVIVHSHGTSSGALAIGEMLSETGNPEEADKKLVALKERLLKKGHRNLIEMDGIGKMSIPLAHKIPEGNAWVVSIKPPFWEYVQKRGSFKRSFFYISACYSDQTSDLREAIRAGAYFAWKHSVSPSLSGTFLCYLLSLLNRPTYSAEEAYYNLVRVVNTKQMIYEEDRILNGVIPTTWVERKNITVVLPVFQESYYFNGYGYNGKNLIQYKGNGWLSPKLVDVGQIWWLVFAGRWGQDTPEGVKNLTDCYNKYWKSKKLGRLGSPFCNNANAGKPPKKDEVAYAIYLLTGNKDMSFSGTYVPRWTLNETR